jgi:hypothetical protein
VIRQGPCDGPEKTLPQADFSGLIAVDERLGDLPLIDPGEVSLKLPARGKVKLFPGSVPKGCSIQSP